MVIATSGQPLIVAFATPSEERKTGETRTPLTHGTLNTANAWGRGRRERERGGKKERKRRKRERASHSRGPRGRALVHDEVLEELPGAVAGHVDVQRVPVEEAGGLDDDVLRVTTKAKKEKQKTKR